MQLFSAVAALTAKNITGKAFRMYSHKHSLVGVKLSFYQSNMFKLVNVVFKGDGSPFATKTGGEAGLRNGTYKPFVF